MSGCQACDRAEIPPKTTALDWAEALITEHHALLRAEREKVERVQAMLAEWEKYWWIPPETERVFQRKLREALGMPPKEAKP